MNIRWYSGAKKIEKIVLTKKTLKNETLSVNPLPYSKHDKFLQKYKDKQLFL